MRRWAGRGLALALLASGCAAPNYPTQTPASPAATPAPIPGPPPTASAPPPIMPMPDTRPAPTRRTEARDSCGANQMQGMVGHLRTLIPVPLDPARQRVACTTCPMTQDFDPGRLNFLFDAKTGLIKEVRCG